MTGPTRLERELPSILGDLVMGPYPDYIDDVLAVTQRSRQRPAWTSPERWIPMALVSRTAFAPRLPWRTLGIALIVLALLVAALVAVVGSRQQRLPAPFGPAANGVIPFVADGDLYVGDPVTGQTRLLVGGPEEDVAPLTSPDGTRVSFIRVAPTTFGTSTVDLYVIRVDGSDLRKVTPKALSETTWIAWTPDGTRLAVVHPADSVGDGCTLSCYGNQLDLFDASGSGSVRRIAAAAGLDSLQFRPPDGREILFRAGADPWTGGPRSSLTGFGLFVMDAEGTNVRPLAKPMVEGDSLDLTNAVYSPDGARIFYNRWTADASVGDPGCCQLYAMNADGSDQYEFILNAGGAWDGTAVVSPDGTKIAFWHNDKPTHGISVIRADGLGPMIETGPGLSNPAKYVWAPDSSKILMYPTDGSSTNGYLLDPAGGAWTSLQWQSDADIDWQRTAP